MSSVTTARSTKSSASSTTTTSKSSPTSIKGLIASGYGEAGKGVLQPEFTESKRRKNLKRFFFRLKESIGLVEKTEVSKEFTQSLAHLDKYKHLNGNPRIPNVSMEDAIKLCLDTLSEAIYGAIQENPQYRKEDFKMEMNPPTGEQEHEVVASCLKNSGGFEDYKNHSKLVELYEKLGNEQREYIRNARRSVQNIRSFIQQIYWTVGTQRTELESLRREMDFAKSELKAAKDAQLVAVKNQLYNMAVAAFEEKLKQVTAMLDELPKNKATHLADLEEWVSCTNKYHQRSAQVIEELEK